MKASIIFALALASSSAMALESTMDLKGRFDYVRTETENKAATTTKSSSGEYKISYLRLGTSAKFNDTTKLKLVLDFKDSNAAVTNSVSEFVDEAILTKTFGDFSFMAGKQTVLVGGRENDWSKRDMYINSKYNDQIADNLVGLTAGYTIMNQSVYLQHLETASNGGGFTDKKATGLAYYGNFMDGMISPIVSYHKVGTTRQGLYDTFLAAGVQVSAMNVVFEFDYLMLEQEKNGTNTAGNTADAELNSMVAHVRYNHENFKPFFKYIMEKGDNSFTGLIAGAVETERNVWELGLEYVPNKDEDMRYHAVYSSAEAKQTSGAGTRNKDEEQKIYAGLAFGMNILK